MSAAPSTLPTAGTANPTEKAARITPEEREALFLYFDKTRWPLNKRLPRGNLGKDLAAIAQKHGLEKSQIARQLKNFKDKKYRLKDVVGIGWYSGDLIWLVSIQ